MKKVLFVILHGFLNKERCDIIKKTWGIGQNLLFYSDYDDQNNNVIKVSDRTDYHSNEEKHVNVLNYLAKNIKYEWFMFCDDDTFVDTEKIINKLDFLDKNKVHGSVMNCWPKDKSLYYCSGGAGYLIHKSLLSTIGEKIKVMNTGYSDVTLGLFLRENGIGIINHEDFRSQPPSYFNYTDEEISKYTTFHYVKNIEEMLKLTNLMK